jgi:hypothetical protein
LKEPVIFPEPILQVGEGEDDINGVGAEDRTQLESREGKPVPVTVIVMPTGPSEGERKIAGPTTGGATVKTAEAVSPKVPVTVTV